MDAIARTVSGRKDKWMRLIDADAFDERVRAAGGMSEEELSEDFKDGVLAVLYMMSKQPTITAQSERQKGEWITDDLSGIISCSRCGNDAPMETTGGRQYKSKFCQTCGADMRGGQDDEHAQYFVDVEEALNMATNVLTAQPETHDKRTETHARDCISRQAAISLPVKPKEDRYFQTQNLDDAYDYGWRDLQRCIEKLPPAQPERKTGTWIAVDYFADGKPAYREWECSACGCVVEDEKPTGNFCKMCGADMRGKQDDEQASTNND